MSGFEQAKLKYFNIRSFAEISRIMMKVCGFTFEDIRYPLIFHDDGSYTWDEYLRDQQAHHFTENLDRLPILEVNGVKIGQSKAIERYIARKGGLLGKSDEEAALIEAVAEHVRDIKEKFSPVRWMKPEGPAKEEALNKWFNEDLVDWLKKLEASLPLNPSGEPFVVGTTATYGDIVIWNLLRDSFTDERAVGSFEKANTTRLNAIADRVAAIEAVRQHLETRPKTHL